MDRRNLLRAAPLLVLAGCVGRGGSGGDDGDGGDDSDDQPRVTDRTFDDTGECSLPETATVDASASEVRVDGCITGPNGCAVARLDAATVDGDELTVVVTTERDAPPDVACTEALVYRSYTATITLDGSVGSVRVVHDAAGGRETVVDRSV
ncbi:hypothetical protein [Haloplanus aerogenes]|uniref:Uncharacterized protein n=1 Tax=Haloplanus aerogenes TaxID=660522 RepID=A0A3M0CW00_9EURY|nr:hypothetical protein [Haloplanus aerogenes]AZH27053.1 hypothetical protein DU502_17465 [Haloplanus aerogenes]RMB13451.1 hypothetical protein ATH50_2786 [Haloplanus aerogenes]